MFVHEHPLNLIDLWLGKLQHKEEYEEDEEENGDDLTTKQDYRCLCFLCKEEINWFHRYCYRCDQCDYSIHKFCLELPEKWEAVFHAHTLYLLQRNIDWWCDICRSDRKLHDLSYFCSQCNFDVDINCATKILQMNIIHHPSHIHPLVCMAKQILCKCDACGMEHKGIFYQCLMCSLPFIHNKCAFLPKKLQIQHTTNNFFFHIHHLTLAYSFPKEDQKSKFNPRCRVCLRKFFNENLWIYKCDKCRYYAHLDCATSRSEPFMSILISPGTGKTIKNYEDVEHPNLLHLPFPDSSCSILKRLFFKENGSSTKQISDVTKIHTSHQHPLILKNTQCSDITSTTSSSIKSISFHDPMKRIELLCNGCLRPITTTPLYICANEDGHCNYVLHEWCSRLPTELKDHPDHPQHPLVLHSKTPSEFFGVFYCAICSLPCNGFVYHCDECKYHIDVNCAFLPNELTHNSHPNHLLLRVYQRDREYYCRICDYNFSQNQFSFGCQICDFHLHPECALLVPETTTHKCDKHPMKLSYFPVENHKSEYFCEICEEEFDPEFPFYHCHECMQSIHPSCAPSILQYETYMSNKYVRGVYKFVNVKFGGTYNNIKIHSHPLSFTQGIATDGNCVNCGETLQYEMIFKCLDCKFALHFNCCELFITLPSPVSF